MSLHVRTVFTCVSLRFHPVAQVLGDRSIKYRYLNPNTLVVVAGPAPGQALHPDDREFLHSTM